MVPKVSVTVVSFPGHCPSFTLSLNVSQLSGRGRKETLKVAPLLLFMSQPPRCSQDLFTCSLNELSFPLRRLLIFISQLSSK